MKKIFCLFLVLPAICFAGKFDDITELHPNYKAIEWLHSQDIVEGYRDGRRTEFRPEQSVSRAEAIKMVIGVSELPLVQPQENPFPDVYTEYWFAPYVQTAFDSGVVKGFSDGKFHPASQVTRAEMVVMILRLLEAPIASDEGGDWATPFVEFAQKMRIIEGEESIHASLTRGDVAEILHRTQIVAATQFKKVFQYSGQGRITQYPTSLIGKKTANGELLDSESLTAAHRSLPFGTKVRIWNDENSIVVAINDRISSESSSVLVLSQKAFSLLENLKQGTTYISYEVFSSPTDELPSVPEYVRPSFSDNRREQPPVPDSITNKISELRGELEEVSSKIKPIFDTTVVFLASEFFENIYLRNPFPRTIKEGTVLNFSGTTLERGHKKATLFLQPLSESGAKEGKQLLFSGDISGKNFSFPVVLDQAGEFLVGVVLDEDTQSRVETIEVVRLSREEVLPLGKEREETEFGVRVLPEEQRVFFDFPTLQSHDLLQLEVTQSSRRKKLFLEAGINKFSLPYSWFSSFEEGEKVFISLSQSESKDGTIPQRTTGWRKLSTQQFELVPGFLDVESKKVVVYDFPRWRRNRDAFSLLGRIVDQDIVLADHAFVTAPSGRVQEIAYIRNGNDFSFEVSPREWGGYAIEVVGADGEIYFNRELYISDSWVLPVLPPKRIALSSNTVPGVRAWTNAVRSELHLSSLVSNAPLNEFAQNYAERMAQENFISHTSPTGQTFESRIKAADLEGAEFGENLGMGSSLQIALDGLRSSGSHFKNISSRKWRYIGIGIAKDSLGKNWYVSQVFRR